MRLTVDCDIPVAAAIERVDQCVACRGCSSSVFTITRSTSSSLTVRGLPGRGSSCNPSKPRRANRPRHLLTVLWLQPSSAAISALEPPSAAANTIRPRNASACELFGRRAHRRNTSRSSAPNTTSARAAITPPSSWVNTTAFGAPQRDPANYRLRTLVHRPVFTVLNRGTSASALKQVTSMPSRRMVAVARKAREIVLGRDERVELERIVRASTSEQRLVARARLVLLAAAGETNAVIAPRVGLSAHKVSKWRTRFAEERLAGLFDRPRPGGPRRYGHDERLAVFRTACAPPPQGETHWTVRALASAVGISKSRV